MHIRFYFVASFLSIITHVSFFSFTNLSFSFSQLSGFLEQAYQSSGPTPSLHSLETVWDWKSWLGNHMHGLTGHSAPHVFHFFCDAAGRPVICDKAYHTQGTYSDPYQLLTSIPTGLFIISPPYISPATPHLHHPFQELLSLYPPRHFHLKCSVSWQTTAMLHCFSNQSSVSGLTSLKLMRLLSHPLNPPVIP